MCCISSFPKNKAKKKILSPKKQNKKKSLADWAVSANEATACEPTVSFPSQAFQESQMSSVETALCYFGASSAVHYRELEKAGEEQHRDTRRDTLESGLCWFGSVRFAIDWTLL